MRLYCGLPLLFHSIGETLTCIFKTKRLPFVIGHEITAFFSNIQIICYAQRSANTLKAFVV